MYLVKLHGTYNVEEHYIRCQQLVSFLFGISLTLFYLQTLAILYMCITCVFVMIFREAESEHSKKLY